MFDENQIVKVRWGATNTKHYKSKGYVYTKYNDEFYVKAADLMPRCAVKVNVICDYCGKEFQTQYDVLMKGKSILNKDSCHSCSCKKANELSFYKRANASLLKAKKICDDNGYELLSNIDTYLGVKEQIVFKCPKHGVQTMMFDNFIRGHKCMGCAIDIIQSKKSHDSTYVETLINQTGNTLLNPEEYTGYHISNLKIRCACGNIYTASLSSFESFKNRCHICSQKESSGEVKIRKFLLDKHIDFVQEKRFKDCRDKLPLPFDFYIPKYNLCIEFDGQHHYEDVYGEKRLEITKKHDKIKNQYCKDNNISLLRIPYWKGNIIETIIEQEIQTLSKRYSLVT